MVRLNVTLNAASVRDAENLVEGLRFQLPGTQVESGCMACTAWLGPDSTVHYVEDWATEFYQAGSAKCWVGICGGGKNEQVPFEELDKIVKTSSGESIESWRTRS